MFFRSTCRRVHLTDALPLRGRVTLMQCWEDSDGARPMPSPPQAAAPGATLACVQAYSNAPQAVGVRCAQPPKSAEARRASCCAARRATRRADGGQVRRLRGRIL